MMTARRLLTVCLFTCSIFSAALAQSEKPVTAQAAGPVVTVAAAATDRVRFTAPGTVVQMRLEVLDAAGQTLFDHSSKGNVLDWVLLDGAGARPGAGAYLCVVTVKSLSGKLSQRLGTVIVQEKQVSLEQLEVGQLTAAQQAAVGPVEGKAALTIMKAEAAEAATVVAHDGADGRVTSTVGALTFRTGDVFTGKDVEQMRVTEDGRVGIGTDNPQAKLDVAGDIRSSGTVRAEKVEFPDGTVQTSGQSGKVDEEGKLIPNAIGSGTQNYLAKWQETGGLGLLGDSAVFETGGRVGINTTTPAHPFTVRQNIGSAGVNSLGELYVDRDNIARSSSVNMSTAGVNKWLFGMPYNSNGFHIFDLQASPAPGVSRFFVHPTNGNIGIGTITPTSRLEIVGQDALKVRGFQPFLTLQDDNASSKQGVVQSVNGGVNLLTDSGAAVVVRDVSGNVGIGTANPTSKLEIIAQDGLAITGFQPFLTLRDTGAPGAPRSILAGGNGDIGFYPNSFIGGSPSMIIRNGTGNVSIGAATLSQARLRIAVPPTNDLALSVEGQAIQNRDRGGFVKAMIFVGAQGQIYRCYNGVTGVSAGNCGFSVSRTRAGNYDIDFGFRVDDRFISITSSTILVLEGEHIAAREVRGGSPSNLISVITFFTDEDISETDSDFYVIVF